MIAAERVAKQLFMTILDLHSSHGTNWIAESKGKKKVRFRKLALKHEEP